MKTAGALWRFSRPHTIIGTVISILTLYMIVCAGHEAKFIPYLLLALTIGITSNIFIVGINQIADVHIDRINKPYLPIPSGELSLPSAKIIAYTSLLLSLLLALCISFYLFSIILISSIIGWAYSMPPFHLKQHHLTAAIAITTVRGILLNAGGFLVFNYLVNHSFQMPENVKILTVFIVVFSIVISWFKDLPDIEGDRKHNIRTFAILYSPKTALLAGNVLVISAYLFTIYIKYTDLFSAEISKTETVVLLAGHIILLILFLLNTFFLKLEKHESVKKFYTRFWWFFFSEYILYLLAYVWMM